MDQVVRAVEKAAPVAQRPEAAVVVLSLFLAIAMEAAAATSLLHHGSCLQSVSVSSQRSQVLLTYVTVDFTQAMSAMLKAFIKEVGATRSSTFECIAC
jgi:hypothetical protein